MHSFPKCFGDLSSLFSEGWYVEKLEIHILISLPQLEPTWLFCLAVGRNLCCWSSVTIRISLSVDHFLSIFPGTWCACVSEFSTECYCVSVNLFCEFVGYIFTSGVVGQMVSAPEGWCWYSRVGEALFLHSWLTLLKLINEGWKLNFRNYFL